MNVTDEQLDLLRILVGVYNGGCRSEFLLAQSFEGDALIYDDRAQPNIEINAAVSDFERLASEDLLDVRYTELGTLRGKPTAKGVRLVASGGMKNATTDTASWTGDQKVQIALDYLRTKGARCPLDGSSLKVADTTAEGGPPFSIDAYCPLCGNEMDSDSIYDLILERGSAARAEAIEHHSRTAHVKPADQRLALRSGGSWSDGKKWVMGIAGTLLTAAVIGSIAIIWNELAKGNGP